MTGLVKEPATWRVRVILVLVLVSATACFAEVYTIYPNPYDSADVNPEAYRSATFETFENISLVDHDGIRRWYCRSFVGRVRLQPDKDYEAAYELETRVGLQSNKDYEAAYELETPVVSNTSNCHAVVKPRFEPTYPEFPLDALSMFQNGTQGGLKPQLCSSYFLSCWEKNTNLSPRFPRAAPKRSRKDCMTTLCLRKEG
ncbi:UNVERIFIED_CONTAM: hypothetical protein FKN15_016174 [Acipenser sinensis]